MPAARQPSALSSSANLSEDGRACCKRRIGVPMPRLSGRPYCRALAQSPPSWGRVARGSRAGLQSCCRRAGSAPRRPSWYPATLSQRGPVARPIAT
eukprot:1335627-Alexandrium_andersonii.AAC.1